ncbi:MAG: type IV pilin protein [Gammaproteobacteria bacterium]
MTYRKAAGFTLIELMIVVVIVGILAAVAYPAYRSSVIKTRRSDAQVALTNTAALQEKWYMDHNSYATNADINSLGGATSPQGYYDIAIANNNCSTIVGTRTVYSCFKATATPNGQGGQSDDTTCATLSIDQDGVKSNTGSGTVADCW